MSKVAPGIQEKELDRNADIVVGLRLSPSLCFELATVHRRSIRANASHDDGVRGGGQSYPEQAEEKHTNAAKRAQRSGSQNSHLVNYNPIGWRGEILLF